jgi:hypothetical protein
MLGVLSPAGGAHLRGSTGKPINDIQVAFFSLANSSD